jgi:hypothetical protein
MDHIPDDLLELQARFDQWRANRIYNRGYCCKNSLTIQDVVTTNNS